MGQSYATFLPGRVDGMARALQMAAPVRGLTGSGVILGEPTPAPVVDPEPESGEDFTARIVATITARMVALSLRD